MRALFDEPSKPIRLSYHAFYHIIHASLTERIRFRENAAPGSFLARDNLANFISWTRGRGIKDSVLFETADLVEARATINQCLNG